MSAHGTWLEDYSASLDHRDVHEQASHDIILSYEALAIRLIESDPTPRENTADVPAETGTLRIPPSLFGGRSATPNNQESETLTSLRNHLVVAQKSKSDLEQRLASTERVVAQTQDSLTAKISDIRLLDRKIGTLESQVSALQRRLRDRESELREKMRLVEQVQDEHVGLEMQVNLAEQRCKEVEAENFELVERYKERVRQEVEQMNKGLEGR